MLFSEYANLNCHEIYISYNLKSNMSIFDMNVISLKIFLYFVILILDLKKKTEKSILIKTIILKLKSLITIQSAC